MAGEFAAVAHDTHEEIDKDHGRLEVRRYWITEDLRTLPDTPLWAGLRSIGMVERRCLIGTTETVEHTLLHQLDPRSSQTLRQRRARPLAHGKPPALAPRRPV